MKMTVSENDKKILSYLVAFLIAILFSLIVFRPLLVKNSQLRKELSTTKVELKNAERKRTNNEDMEKQEAQMTEKAKETLARFYPMLQSQSAEQMVTTLLLNHNLQIQSVNITMPETSNELTWYQYSENAQPQEEESEEENMRLYAARIICVADGDSEDLWKLIDDISINYPAISIAGAEWSATEKIVEETQEDSENVVSKTVRTDRLTLNLEIFMCNQ